MSLNRNNRFNWLKSHVSELLFYECPNLNPWAEAFYSLNYFTNILSTRDERTRTRIHVRHESMSESMYWFGPSYRIINDFPEVPSRVFLFSKFRCGFKWVLLDLVLM